MPVALGSEGRSAGAVVAELDRDIIAAVERDLAARQSVELTHVPFGRTR